jgi:2'-5' RNA ligase
VSKDRIRAFVAVELAPEVRGALAEEVERLAQCGANVKWVAPGDLHVTLKFLGQVDRHGIPDVLAAIERGAAASRPFEMEVAGLAFFPKPTRPRVVAAGVDEEGVRALAGLFTKLEEGLVPMGFKKDERGFKAHVTLGRVKSPKGIGRLADRLLTFDGEPFGEETVESVALFMSELRREGPVYTALGHATLGG